MNQRDRFASRLGFILVSAGCAIGLGNVWKFPYMTGQYGGAAFILVYLLFLLILGLPVLVSELAVGRGSQRSAARSFQVLQPEGTSWHKLTWLGVAGNYIIMMFYTVVAGWMLYYCYKMLSGAFVGASTEQVAAIYDNMTASPAILGGWMVVSVALGFGICALGLQNGVEKIGKVMMLGLLGLMVVLAARTVTLPGAAEGLRFYLVPDFGRMRDAGIGNVIFGAMSQSFFTLSIGMGGMAIFGSYLDKDRSLTGEAVSITLLDTFVALMAGLIVIPACFAYGVEPTAGPPLIFITLPNIFSQMAGGRVWGALFFLFLSFAALTTIVAVFENILSFAMDLWGWSRKKAVAVNLAAIIVLSLPCVLGFNVLSDIQPLGEGTNIMDLEDFLVSNNILPLGSVIYLLFCTRRYGWGWDRFMQEANAGSGMKVPDKVRFYVSNILPLIVVAVYLKGYYDMFKGKGTALFLVWMVIAAAFVGTIGYFVFWKSRRGAKK